MNTTKLILALAAVAATAVEDKPVAVAAVLEDNKPDPSPRSLRGKSAGAIEAKLQNRVGGRQPRMGSYVPPEPLNVYVSDWGTEQLLLSRGECESECTVSTSIFWSDPEKSNRIKCVQKGRDGYVYAGEMRTDAVYKLKDTDDDGVADDVKVWFSAAANAEGFPLPIPMSVWDGEEAVYILNAGNELGEEADVVYATKDLNSDGDANEAGEATKWLEFSPSVPFSMEFQGDVAYIYDQNENKEGFVWRAEDKDKSGSVETSHPVDCVDAEGTGNEFCIYAKIAGIPPLGISVSAAMDGPDVVYVDANFMPASKGVFRMKGGGQIPLTDTELVWDPSLHPVIGDIAGADIRAKDGEIWVTTDARVLRLVDMDGDGKYNSEGETLVWLEGAPLDRPKALDVV